MNFGSNNREFFILVIGLLLGGLALWIIADGLLVSGFILGCVLLLVGHTARVVQQHKQATSSSNIATRKSCGSVMR